MRWKTFSFGSSVVAWALLLLAPVAAQAGQFQFGTMVRAGVAGSGDWELAAGDSSGALPPSAANSRDLGSSHFRNGIVAKFDIDYQKNTNTVTLTVQANSSGPGSGRVQVTFNPVGGTVVGRNAIWRIPIGSLYVAATQIPTASSIQVSKLRLTGPLTVLNPIQQTTMAAAQSNTPGGALVRQSADIVFTTRGAGNWNLDGEILMTGLPATASGSGARRSQLQFGLTAFASDLPEPGTLLGTGAVLGLLLWKTRQKGPSKAKPGGC